MRHRRVLGAGGVAILAVPLAIALLLVGASPSQARPLAPAGDDDSTALDLLSGAAAAADHTAYRGVQLVSSWSKNTTTSETVRVRGVPGRGTYLDVEGTPRRHGGTVRTRPAPDELDHGQVRLLAANYTLLCAGLARVAGRVAEVVDARSLGYGAHTAARYWLDKATGLMLRREVFDDQGRVVRQSAFLDIRFTATARAPRHAEPLTSAKAAGRKVAPTQRPRLERANWTVPIQLPDALSLYDMRLNSRGRATSLHLSYSDGISTVSVFEQHGHLDEAHLSGWHRARVGPRTVYVRDTFPHQLTWASSGTVFTVLADAPDATVARAVRALPGRTEDQGLWARLARGFERIVSWCNPF